ncbi:MAG: ATP-binding protein [Holosporaceae bacterium]|jgi:anti-sigma regulatory factor (Ser/Thr protein kinase)|nr:ATP-binding protein [Holosporaceae bacterium]
MLIKIKNNIEEISRVCDEVQEFCSRSGIPSNKYHDIVLILDEVVTNIINYAYPNNDEHVFSLNIKKKADGYVYIKLVDNGIAFDPLAKEDPDVESTIEERKIGGLGIFIVKQLSEQVIYSRIDDKNQLEIKVSIHNKEETNGSKNNN